MESIGLSVVVDLDGKGDYVKQTSTIASTTNAKTALFVLICYKIILVSAQQDTKGSIVRSISMIVLLIHVRMVESVSKVLIGLSVIVNLDG